MKLGYLLKGRRKERSMRGLLILIATASLALTLGAGEGRAVITEPIPVDVASAPPPIPSLPPGGDTPPPSEAISDPVEPTAACGDWYRTSSYGGSWSSGSTWWEYSCTYAYPQCIGACNADWIPSIWVDYFYWDGSQPVFYGEFYGDYYLSSWGWPACEYWWDAPTNQWYRFESPDCSASPASNAAPAASFTVSCTGLSCSFDASASTDTDGTIQTYSWNFGDETSGSGMRVEHAYAQAGTHTVALTVTDNSGASATAAKDVAVTNAAPTAAFVVSCSGLSCSFDGSGSSDPDGTLMTYRWDFGDGTSGSGKTASHTYARAGSYSVSLTVTDNAGATASDSKAVSPISLTARGYKLTGLQKVDLSWNGPSGASFDVYRDDVKIATVQATAYTDNINKKGSGSYTYKICGSAFSSCSDRVTVSF